MSVVVEVAGRDDQLVEVDPEGNVGDLLRAVNAACVDVPCTFTARDLRVGGGGPADGVAADTLLRDAGIACTQDTVEFIIPAAYIAAEKLRALGVEPADEDRFTAAVTSGNQQVAALMLEAGLLDSAFLRSSLERCVTTGYVRSVLLMVQSGVPFGQSLLHCAAFDNRDMARVFLKWGADPNVRDASGQTAVMIAARDGRMGMLRLMVAHGGDPHLGDASGKTPLIWAATFGHLPAVQFLVEEARVACTTADNTGMTAAQWALVNRQHHVADYLNSARAVPARAEGTGAIGEGAALAEAPLDTMLIKQLRVE